MIYIFFSILLIICIFIYYLYYLYTKEKTKRKKMIIILQEYLIPVNESINTFVSFMDDENYFNHRKYLGWENKYGYIKERVNFDLTKTRFPKDLIDPFLKYFIIVKKNQELILAYNDKLVNKLKIDNNDFLDTIESFPLDHQQRDCIIHDEDTMLVLAGAGTGKTSTIVGKVAFLIEKCKVNPDQILLLSFTNKSSKELEERILKVTQKDMNVFTFHKLGYTIISTVLDDKKDIAFTGSNKELVNFIDKMFYDKLNNESYFNLAKRFFLDFPNYPVLVTVNDNGHEQKLRGDDEYEYKSKQEVLIANYLFSNQINYEYERSYEFKTSNQNYRQYKPDFYLTDFKIYIEHFGIDINGNPPGHYSVKQQKDYLEGIEWKRKTHENYNTNLIETFSYEFDNGSIFDNLEKNLISNKVVLKPIVINREDLKNHNITKKKYPAIVLLFCTFLNLMKSNLYKISDFKNTTLQLSEKIRCEQFILLFEPIFEDYEKYLKEKDKIDFSDMISKATEFIVDGKFKHNYKYIIIDEFQDMSFGRFKLIQAMISKMEDIKLFCVGDDWQSIYRFTGTDISIITEFEEYFGYFKELKIENTYRFPDNIIKVSSQIIGLNERQRMKNLKSTRNDDSHPVTIKYYKNDNYENILHNTFSEIPNSSSVFLIGRYNHDKPIFLDSLKSKFPGLEITFLTVHKSKGLEADNIILLNLIDDFLGFPSKIIEDPVLNLVLKNLLIEYEEERRLFYVALTRTKNKIYILNHTSKKLSIFLEQLINVCNDYFDVPENTCPNCYSKIVFRKKFKEFDYYGCNRYPVCSYSKKENQKLTNKYFKRNF